MAHHGPVVELEVRANTDRLSRKLRAIASAATGLADELDAIDAEGTTTETQVMEPGFYAPDLACGSGGE
jgi:hypothetical protein